MYTSDDPGLTLTYFTARSAYAPYALVQGWQNPGIYEYFPSRREIPGYPGIYLGNTRYMYFPILQNHSPCLPESYVSIVLI